MAKLTLSFWMAVLTLAVAVAAPCSAAEPLDITVFGGTGTFGKRIVHEALERGHRVTVISRDPSRVAEKHERLAIKQGNILDSTAVARLMAGQAVVVSAIGADRANNPDYHIFRKAAESLVSAARSLGVKAPYVIVVGSSGSLELPNGSLLLEQMPERIRPEMLGQKDALDYLRTVSEVKWTYFSPASSISRATRTGEYRLGDDQLVLDAARKNVISIEDYAAATIDEAEQPKHVGKRFTIGY